MTMFKNYFMITLRNIKKHKVYSAINIFGLAVGIACCLLMIGYVFHELNFENQFFGPKIRNRTMKISPHVAFGGWMMSS